MHDHINYGFFYASQHIISNIFVQERLHKLELDFILQVIAFKSQFIRLMDALYEKKKNPIDRTSNI